MTQFNSFNPSFSNPDLEGAMNKILKKRTGKTLQRNIESAKLPQHESLDKDEVANQIFDNIISRRSQQAEETETAPQKVQDAPEVVDAQDAESAYYAEMDAMLFGNDETSANASEEAPVSSYDILDQVLLGGESEAQIEPPAPPPQSREDFSRTLDELLDNHENPFA